MASTTTITLPDGGIAVIRDPETVTEAQRRPVTRLQMRLAVSPVGQLFERKAKAAKAAAEADATDSEAAKAAAEVDAEVGRLVATDLDAMELLDDLNDALIVALVESYNGAPVVAATDLPSRAYDALKVETAKYVTKLMPSFAPSPDPASPTPPSAT
jgi:hypothetical protein